MTSTGNAATPDGPDARRSDVAFGDRHGRSAPPPVVERNRALHLDESMVIPHAGAASLARCGSAQSPRAGGASGSASREAPPQRG
jgi:hypothetical protein